MTSLAEIQKMARRLGVKSKPWIKGGKVRLYALTPRNDLQVYLECDGDESDITGAAFKVYCSTAQHANWIKSQTQQARARYIALWHAYVACHYQGVGPEPNGYGADINAMIDESRAWVEAELIRIEQEESVDD